MLEWIMRTDRVIKIDSFDMQDVATTPLVWVLISLMYGWWFTHDLPKTLKAIIILVVQDEIVNLRFVRCIMVWVILKLLNISLLKSWSCHRRAVRRRTAHCKTTTSAESVNYLQPLESSATFEELSYFWWALQVIVKPVIIVDSPASRRANYSKVHFL
jgi:hypothetical protein